MPQTSITETIHVVFSPILGFRGRMRTLSFSVKSMQHLAVPKIKRAMSRKLLQITTERAVTNCLRRERSVLRDGISTFSPMNLTHRV